MGEEAVFRNVGEGAAAADGQHLFHAVGKEAVFDEHGRRGTGRGLHQEEGFPFPFDFIKREGLGEGKEGAYNLSAPLFRKGGDSFFSQKGHEAAAGEFQGKVLEIRRNESSFPAEFGKRYGGCVHINSFPAPLHNGKRRHRTSIAYSLSFFLL